MNENIGTFGHDRIKQRTKKGKNHEKLQPHHKYNKTQRTQHNHNHPNTTIILTQHNHNYTSTIQPQLKYNHDTVPTTATITAITTATTAQT